jgi:hypothetical protein
MYPITSSKNDLSPPSSAALYLLLNETGKIKNSTKKLKYLRYYPAIRG